LLSRCGRGSGTWTIARGAKGKGRKKKIGGKSCLQQEEPRNQWSLIVTKAGVGMAGRKGTPLGPGLAIRGKEWPKG